MTALAHDARIPVWVWRFTHLQLRHRVVQALDGGIALELMHFARARDRLDRRHYHRSAARGHLTKRGHLRPSASSIGPQRSSAHLLPRHQSAINRSSAVISGHQRSSAHLLPRHRTLLDRDSHVAGLLKQHTLGARGQDRARRGRHQHALLRHSEKVGR